MNEAEHHQLELERLQQLDEARALDEALALATEEAEKARMEQFEEAIERANCGLATEDDWNIIRFEHGIITRPVLHTITIGNENVTDSESK
jgi:hypothetical protein